MSDKAPSDWQRGVLDAAAWLKSPKRIYFFFIGDRIAEDMLSELSDLEKEGTETRVVKQIAQFLRETAHAAEMHSALDSHETGLDGRTLAQLIEDGAWKPK